MTTPAIIMVAPNGARKTKKHHKNLPVSVSETVAEAKRCYQAGATILHAHVRDQNEEHVLDPVLYRELIQAMQAEVPDMLVQMTTEAVGKYTPEQQAQCVYDVKPQMISLAIREMAGQGTDLDHAKAFYHWNKENNIHVQHIVYDDQDLAHLFKLQQQNIIPEGKLCALFVLGRFIEHREATPDDITPFLTAKGSQELDWFVCAFGSHEQACALAAIEQGGHARIGFENNLIHSDGKQAENTAELVLALKQKMTESQLMLSNSQQTKDILEQNKS